MIEIIIIVSLLIFLVDNLYFNSSDRYKIVVTDKDLIYSEDNSVPFTGKMQDTLDNKLIMEFNVVNGLKQGEFILLTMDGNFAVKGFMNKNKNDGNWKYYYENGQLECTGDFDNDKPTGKWIWFYKNGLTKCIGTFINGKPDGQWRKYNEDGFTCRIINYHSGEVISFIQLDKLVRV
jgi:antitoxin component YwqK of YwqJK toxin-antitoxin module